MPLLFVRKETSMFVFFAKYKSRSVASKVTVPVPKLPRCASARWTSGAAEDMQAVLTWRHSAVN